MPGMGCQQGMSPYGAAAPRAAPSPSVAPPRRVHLDESIAGPVVRDGEAKRILCLGHLHLLCLTPDVGEDEVLQADLSPQQLLHVYFVRVERAKEDLPQGTPVTRGWGYPGRAEVHWWCRGRSQPWPDKARSGCCWSRGVRGHPACPGAQHCTIPVRLSLGSRLHGSWHQPGNRQPRLPACVPGRETGTEPPNHFPEETRQPRDENALFQVIFRAAFASSWGAAGQLATDGATGLASPPSGAKPPPHALATTAPSPQWARC